MNEASLLRRGQSRIDGGVNVTVTALSAEESERLLGYDVAAAGIQPVWVKVVNREKRRWYLPPITIDSEYYSPMEVAWIGHRPFSATANRQVDAHLNRVGLPAVVEPEATTSGFVFTNLDEGIKYASFELVAPGPKSELRRFSFLTEVPGHATDFLRVYGDGLNASSEQRYLD